MSEMEKHQQRARELVEALIPAEEAIPRFKGLFYGPSGAGKTVLAGALATLITPPNKRILYVDTSEGYMVLKQNHPQLFNKIRHILPFQSLEHMQTLSLMLLHKAEGFEDIGTIIVDETTKMASIDLLRTQMDRDPNALVPEWPDYNIALQRMRRTLDALFQNKELNVILVGHEKDKKNKKGEIIRTYPSFNPEVAKEVKESLHLVGFCSADVETDMSNPTGPKKYVRKCQVQPTNLIDAKTRVDKFSSHVVSHEEVLERTLDWLNRGGSSVVDSTVAEDPVDDLPDVTSLEEMENTELEIDEAPAWTND